ncbi:similar to rna-dependent rna polymerase [Plenodomus lingam JN3]|uniref:RNA-dependent RNA polymerase n=1 Tax=Leptosphaeria maculans (strain JN3 / isolate v23.1.3 / race Av1-4-5-6-7-8) TaxID=985895 RepID=E5A380_LEPMJ|nr:similar to rna-dependent rna polymerase [Plenodomus lingam JN3]CBX98093.1 similar to rna-dependent rna polymerase [Plenodomus lingam JN3]
MDIFIENVPSNANHIELQIFLKDRLDKLGVLAFEIKKFRGRQNGRHFAILTVSDTNNGNAFLQLYGSRGRTTPLYPLMFQGESLRFSKSNRPGQPEPLKVRTLQEKEESMRAKMRAPGDIKQPLRSNQPTLAFNSLRTGVWDHDQCGLAFDSKFRDLRSGFVTFGSTAIVLYLQQNAQSFFDWHGRIDIPHSIIDFAIPSHTDLGRTVVTLALKSPPKFYNISSTDDLHLYAGTEPPITADILSGFSRLNLGTTNRTNRLERLCSLSSLHDKSSALCMVYSLDFPDIRTAQHAYQHVKDFSVSDTYCWKRMTVIEGMLWIEHEFAIVERELARYGPQIPTEFNFAVRFQLTALLLEGYIKPVKLIGLIPHVLNLARIHGAELTASALRQLARSIPMPSPSRDASQFTIEAFVALLNESIQDSKERELTGYDLSRKQRKHNHLALTYKATITPTGMLLRGPDWDVSNRVLRKYGKHTECFMRVFFADEDGLSVFFDPRASQDRVYERFRGVLRNGITVAGRRFDFLGFSHASLRSHQAWFMTPFIKDGISICARDIIEDLGDFSHIRCSARCAARIGQAFSDTIFSVRVPDSAYVTESKVDVKRNGRYFSDGCGTISLELMRKVWNALPPERREQRPTVLQIRYRGAKGVLSLDTSLVGEQLHVRQSMTKYIAKEGWKDLELCGAAYKPLTVFLNHQFIKILEDLGVPERNFKAIQNEAVDTLKLITEHPINAASFLEYSHSSVYARTPRLFELMHQIGLSFHADRFLTDIVEVAAMSNLRSLKYRARIPISQGYLLYGIMDETGILKEGEVYVATKSHDAIGHKSRKILIGDRVIITRAPALHPGDVQIVKAVDVPEYSPLRALHNCVVFSQQGARDLPSQLSGGDLDGDLFHIIYDSRLIPDFTVPPADYKSEPPKDLGRPVQVNDMVDFFVEYMNMDRLGQISNKHKIRADIKPNGTRDPDCILLAQLASDAVDFSKSGNPADINKVPRGSDWIRPDFMAPGSNLVINELGSAELEELEQDDVDAPDRISVLDADKARMRYYRSDKVLGVLYRDIDEQKFFARMKHDFENFRHSWGGQSLMSKLRTYIERETRGVLWAHHRAFAEDLREYYEDNMLEIMDTLRPTRGKPLTELEVFSGNILGKKERAPSRHIREANLEVQERFNRDVSAIIQRLLRGDGDWEGGGGGNDHNDEDTETLPRAIACFMVALETDGWGNYRSLKSWKYVAAAVCLEQLWKYQGGKLRPV